MASKKRTWVWIVVGIAAVCTVAVVALAGVGFYFVSKRIDAKRATPAEALASLDEEARSFGGRTALYTVDPEGVPHLTTPLESLPQGPTKSTDLWIHAWDPNRGRLVKLSLPFWMLKMGDQKIRVARDEGGFKIEELNFDVAALERVGPVLIIDHRGEDGERVLIWTK